jgi:hypothetical protein
MTQIIITCLLSPPLSTKQSLEEREKKRADGLEPVVSARPGCVYFGLVVEKA